jgi:ABC-type Fe3+-hydroxamate transport system substrate-binding protein
MATSIPRTWFALAAAALSLTACSNTAPRSDTGGGSDPVRVRAADGVVTIPHTPRRIVSVSPTGTEDLYAVGAGGQVVAVDSYSTYPSSAPRTGLSSDKPNVEAIARYRPDLVIVAEDTGGVVAQLRKLHVPALLEPPAASLSAVYEQIEQIGQATGHARNAAGVVGEMKRQVAAIVRGVPRPSRPISVYHELDQTLYSASSRTFVGQVYSLLGLRNIADQAKAASDYPQLSKEYVIASDPSLIVLADTVCCGQRAATVAARPGWRDIAAVRDGHVLEVDDAVASQWGPRFVLFLRAVAGEVEKIERQPRRP